MNHPNSEDTREYRWQKMQYAWRESRLPGVCVIEEEDNKRKQVLAAFSEYLTAQGCHLIVAGQIPADTSEWPANAEETVVHEALSRIEQTPALEQIDVIHDFSRAPTAEHPLVLVVPNLELPVSKLQTYLRESRSRSFIYSVVGAEIGSRDPIPGVYTVFNPHIFPIHIDGNWNVDDEFD